MEFRTSAANQATFGTVEIINQNYENTIMDEHMQHDNVTEDISCQHLSLNLKPWTMKQENNENDDLSVDEATTISMKKENTSEDSWCQQSDSGETKEEAKFISVKIEDNNYCWSDQNVKQEICKLKLGSVEKENAANENSCQRSHALETNELTSELVSNQVFIKSEFEYEDCLFNENGHGVIDEKDCIILKCNFCLHVAKSEVSLHQHMKQNHAMIKCRFCDYTTKRNDYLKRHILTNHEKNDKILKCKSCHYTTQRKDLLARHISATHDDTRAYLNCQFCEYRTKRNDVLTKHVKFKHDVNCEMFKCEFCEYRKKFKDMVVKHMNTKHYENGSIFKCEYCNYVTNRRGNLPQHVRIKHNVRAKY